MEENQENLFDNEWSCVLLEGLPSGVIFEIFKYLSLQDVLHISQTCKRFYDFCKIATLWVQLSALDFSKCSIPYDYKILDTVKKCPHLGTLHLSNVISSESERDFMDEEKTSADRFLLEVLRQCSNLYSLTLSMRMLTDSSANAICAKCERLRSLTLTDNEFISNEGLINLLSYLPLLNKLHIVSCSNVVPVIKHQDEGHHLELRDIWVEDCEFFKPQIVTLLQSCTKLEHLTLIQNKDLSGFPSNMQHIENTGLKTLKTLKIYSQSDFRDMNLMTYELDQLETVKIRNCPVLTHVILQAPKLTHFEIQDSASLRCVQIFNVQLTEINYAGFESLTTFTVHTSTPVLKSIDISGCSSLSALDFLTGVRLKQCVEHLNITGCTKMTSADISSILNEFPNLKSFIFGGDHLTKAEVNSVDLTKLTFRNNKIMSLLPMNIPTLRELTFENCTGLAEVPLVDGLLFGEKKNHGIEGLESLVKEMTDYTPFKGRVGVPSIEHLLFDQVPGIQGTMLSGSLSYFKGLTDLQMKRCVCLRELDIHSLTVLSNLTIESCNHLSSVKVHDVPKLRNMIIKWCSMITMFHVDDVNLLNLDTTGCNFAHFYLSSQTLASVCLSGVCTQPNHTIHLKCSSMTELSINKCNSLDDVTLHRLFTDNPRITSLTLSVSDQIRYISTPSGVTSFSVTALKRLQAITLEKPIKIDHLKLNNLIKFAPESRVDMLRSSSITLTRLEVRAIPKEEDLCLELPNLESLTLDQGIDLINLEILCPKLIYLRIQGCPRLNYLLLKLQKLSQVKVKHSSPLLALKTMVLHVQQIQYLANILTHYTPSVSTLELRESNVTKAYICELGKSIHKLTTVNLTNCNIDKDLQECGSSIKIQGGDSGLDLPLTINISNDMDVG